MHIGFLICNYHLRSTTQNKLRICLFTYLWSIHVVRTYSPFSFGKFTGYVRHCFQCVISQTFRSIYYTNELLRGVNSKHTRNKMVKIMHRIYCQVLTAVALFANKNVHGHPFYWHSQIKVPIPLCKFYKMTGQRNAA